jgi:hypothetical protein
LRYFGGDLNKCSQKETLAGDELVCARLAVEKMP